MIFEDAHADHLQFLESILFASLGRETKVRDYFFVSGGCVSQAVQVFTAAGEFFVKWNETAGPDFYAPEAAGLALLRQTDTVEVPEVIGFGTQSGRPYLILEFMPQRRLRPDYWSRLGAAVAALHRHTQPQFGLSHDNYIGSLPQGNQPLRGGVEFFIERRLKPQAGLALYHDAMPRPLYDRLGRLYEKLPHLLPDEPPALLHGDLWHGNVLAGRTGGACLIDPAVYYGFREADIAFTQLFGGFEPDFYDAYQAEFPLSPGFGERVELYNLYPLLVHVNLFGSGYLAGVERTVRRFG